ncbi:hypothetical protein AZ16_1151 [Bordetella bronchiseptica B18-5 (C3)]|nr:hypothetical protein AZ16_1151 [Bordetella bronchiseptica B18-5 (C3)]KDD93114.1 hypothetical protein L524_1024 [Bordetella bronchiseptica MBORD762]
MPIGNGLLHEQPIPIPGSDTPEKALIFHAPARSMDPSDQ